jgi:hypothetical protein
MSTPNENNGFDYDVFISYTRKDNETAGAPEGGWISMLHRALEVRLNQLLGEDSRVWRDPRLSGNDVLRDELMSIVARTAVLVTILSPGYLRSHWCQDELSCFTEAANDSELPTGNKSRIFKVMKTPVALTKQPAPLQELLGYPFYSKDFEKQRVREFYPDWGPQAREEAAVRIDDLAHEIHRDLCRGPADRRQGRLHDPGAHRHRGPLRFLPGAPRQFSRPYPDRRRRGRRPGTWP